MEWIQQVELMNFICTFHKIKCCALLEDTIWNIDEPGSITWLNAKPKRGEPIDGIFYPVSRSGKQHI